MLARSGQIRVEGLTRRFRGPQGGVVAVQPFDLTVGPGGVTGILGPNGSGKSTLLRMILGLVPPGAGATSVDGMPLTGDGLTIRERVAYAPGELAVYGELTGKAHLRWLTAGRRRGTLARAIELADELGLPLRRRVRGYSHGMKRQLLLAAALAPQVPVRILDEPTEGLDPSKRAQIVDLLARDAARGTTILLSSHHLGEVDRVCDRILFMRAGRLIDEEEARSLFRRARRVTRLTLAQPADATTIEHLEGLGAEEVSSDGPRLRFVLPEATHRATLAAILADESLPAPQALSFGDASLEEIYRTLYGSEGI